MRKNIYWSYVDGIYKWKLKIFLNRGHSIRQNWGEYVTPYSFRHLWCDHFCSNELFFSLESELTEDEESDPLELSDDEYEDDEDDDEETLFKMRITFFFFSFCICFDFCFCSFISFCLFSSQRVQQSNDILLLFSYRAFPSQHILHHNSLRIPTLESAYDEWIGSFELDAYNFAIFPKKAFEVIFVGWLSITFHVDLRVPWPWHSTYQNQL